MREADAKRLRVLAGVLAAIIVPLLAYMQLLGSGVSPDDDLPAWILFAAPLTALGPAAPSCAVFMCIAAANAAIWFVASYGIIALVMRLRRSVNVAKWGVVILVSSTVVSLLLSKVLWGYWVSPPSVIKTGEDHTLAVSAIKYDLNDWSEMALTADAGSHASLPVEASDCPENRLIQGLRAVPPPLPPAVSAQLRQLVIANVNSAPHEQTYADSATRWQGVALLQTNGDERRVIVGRHTGEISDDRYLYVEDLYAFEGERIIPRRQVQFFFEVAGLEGLSLGVIWVMTTVVAVLVASGLGIARKLNAPRPSSFRRA
jgi:hypothetical protein